MQVIQPAWNFEQEPFVDESPDETSYNLRAYFDRMSDEKMLAYNAHFSDQELVDWDGNFKVEEDEPSLMLGCSEREIDVAEYRRVIGQAIAYRNRVRNA
jgi:hypothetical protein